MYKISLFYSFIIHYLKIRLVKPKELIIETSITILSDITNVIVLYVILNVSRVIGGWNNSQIMLLFGYSILTGATAEFFTGDLRNLGSSYIRKGKLDLLLIRPASTILQLMIAEIKIKHIGSIIMGFAICIIEIIKLKLTVASITVLFIGIISSVALLIGISIIIASTDFWSKASINTLFVIEDLKQLAFYPIEIYPLFLRFVLCTVLPFAFAGFFQVSASLGKNSVIFLVLSYLVSCIVWIVALTLWNKGIKKYESIC